MPVKVVSSCKAKLCQINTVRNSFDRNTLLLINSALVFSKHLDCSEFDRVKYFSPHRYQETFKEFKEIQNFACRMVTNKRKFELITSFLRQFKQLPVDQQLLYGAALMSYKCVNGLAHQYLCRKFHLQESFGTQSSCQEEISGTSSKVSKSPQNPSSPCSNSAELIRTYSSVVI